MANTNKKLPVNIHIIDTANMFFLQDKVVTEHIHEVFDTINKWHKDNRGNYALKIPKIYFTYPAGLVEKSSETAQCIVKDLNNKSFWDKMVNKYQNNSLIEPLLTYRMSKNNGKIFDQM